MAFPGTYNFNYYRGDTFSFLIAPKNSNGTAFSLTGFTATFKIANKRGTGATQYSGTTTISTSASTITCTIEPSVGRTLASGTYVYDVQIQNSSGALIYTLLNGTISVTDDISGAI